MYIAILKYYIAFIPLVSPPTGPHDTIIFCYKHRFSSVTWVCFYRELSVQLFLILNHRRSAHRGQGGPGPPSFFYESVDIFLSD